MGTRQRRARGAAVVSVVLAALALAGCSGDQGGDDASDAAGSGASAPPSASPAQEAEASDTPSETPAAEPDQETVLALTVRGEDVEPRGERVRVAVGEPLVFAIDSDTEGELHVHATPEAEYAFGPGTTRKKLTLDQPGVVEVELHEPTEVTVFQLEAR